MFSYENIQRLNDTEIEIYRYTLNNAEKIPYMSIRELAKEMHVSTSTILRFCYKLDVEGYNAFKEKFKEEMHSVTEMPPKDDLNELFEYFGKVNTNSFEQRIDEIASSIRDSKRIMFIGLGSSGSLARYGARYFSNLGKFSIGLEDPYYSIPKEQTIGTTVIILSVSGETSELIEFCNRCKKSGCNLLSITNQANSTISKIADMNISYNMIPRRTNEGYNATTQVPVLFLIEAIARRL